MILATEPFDLIALVVALGAGGNALWGLLRWAIQDRGRARLRRRADAYVSGPSTTTSESRAKKIVAKAIADNTLEELVAELEHDLSGGVVSPAPSDTASSNATSPTPSPKRQAKVLAVLIGGSTFDDSRISPIPSVDAEVQQLAHMLPGLLTLDSETALLVDASFDDVRRTLESVSSQLMREDILLIYWRSHAAFHGGERWIACRNSISAAIPATWFPLDFLSRIVRRSHSLRSVVILDLDTAGVSSPPAGRSVTESGERDSRLSILTQVVAEVTRVDPSPGDDSMVRELLAASTDPGEMRRFRSGELDRPLFLDLEPTR